MSATEPTKLSAAKQLAAEPFALEHLRAQQLAAEQLAIEARTAGAGERAERRGAVPRLAVRARVLVARAPGRSAVRRSRGPEVAVEQVAVRLKCERRRVVPHPALQAQRVHAGRDQQRRARVPQGVEADTSKGRGGHEHASAQAANVRGRPSRPRNKTGSVPCAGRAQHAQGRREVVRERHDARRGVTGAHWPPRTIARLTRRRGAGGSRTRSLHRNAIASEIRNPVAASRSNSDRHLAGIPPSVSGASAAPARP